MKDKISDWMKPNKLKRKKKIVGCEGSTIKQSFKITSWESNAAELVRNIFYVPWRLV